MSSGFVSKPNLLDKEIFVQCLHGLQFIDVIILIIYTKNPSSGIFMVKPKMNWIFSLMTISLIEHSFSAVFFSFVYRDPLKGYVSSKKASKQ